MSVVDFSVMNFNLRPKSAVDLASCKLKETGPVCNTVCTVDCADVGRQLISGQKQKQPPPPQPPLPSQPPPQVLSPLSPACAGLSCNFHPG